MSLSRVVLPPSKEDLVDIPFEEIACDAQDMCSMFNLLSLDLRTRSPDDRLTWH
jgi:hypothetical protein